MRYPQLHADFLSLANIGADPGGGNSRVAYSAADFEARRWIVQRLESAGLRARIDAAGNVIGRLEANVPHADTAAVVVGSHSDTVPNGGRFDGALGVLAGIEVARRLIASGVPRRRPCEVIAFCDEEGRFSPYLGSRAMMGSLDYGRVPRMRDVQGKTLIDVLQPVGLTAEGLADAARLAEEFCAYLELHIEQGPVLEQKAVAIGVVTGIVGQVRMSVKFHGRADHAGTTPMDCRSDAFAAAASYATRLRELVISGGENTAVMTVGILDIKPNTGNVVPEFARLGLEIRDIDAARLMRLAELAETEALAAGAHHDVTIEFRRIYESKPVPLSRALRSLIDRTAAALGLTAITLPSGAGHDAQIMAPHVPSGMIFIPSVGGRSHCPEEATAWTDVEAGIDVLQGCVAALLESADLEEIQLNLEVRK